MIKGIGASDGVAIGKVFKYKKVELTIEPYSITDSEEEIKKYTNSIELAGQAIGLLRDKIANRLGPDHALIFDAHLEILKDPQVSSQVVSKINKESLNASFALKLVVEDIIRIFEQMDDEYMKARAADIKDVFHRVQCALHGVESSSLSDITEPIILVCEDLTPSDTAQLNKAYVLGFATEIGSRTSHSAIMARSMEIPAVLGIGTDDLIKDGDFIILDGSQGLIELSPDQDLLAAYQEKMKDEALNKKRLEALKDAKTTTLDGRHVALGANIGSLKDLEGVMEYGAEGIGLFRTEFLYMNSRDFPTEEDQYQVYAQVLKKMKDKPVVIRTLDIGGDKHLDYMKLPEEMNPFLGHRAIRLCFEHEDILLVQLKALLRAGCHGNLKIMFPMIATTGDFERARAIYEKAKRQLDQAGISYGQNIELGIMIEIPSAALAADHLAGMVDFFSIGTNDLIQYTFAADRMNDKVAYLYQPYNPSLLKLVKMVTDAGKQHNKWVGMCGEMAGDKLSAKLLVGLGLTELSMSASSILGVRDSIMHTSSEACDLLAEQALKLASHNQVKKILEKDL